MKNSPAQLGFRMPAEWEPHSATWLAWPHRRSDWPGKFSTIRWVYAEIIRILSRFERVELLVRPEDVEKCQATLKHGGADMSHVTLRITQTDRSWVRDSGPIFVKSEAGEIAGLDWHFNAWAKYPDWQADDRLPTFVCAALGYQRFEPTHAGRRIVLEGGSIDVNGQGLLLTTEECLLSETQARNPGMSQADLESCFREYLGISQVLWLNRGIAGDDTHGHVDDLARFVAANRVVTVVEDSPADENYWPLQENLERLRGMPVDVVTLPMPSPVVFASQRLPASYANFYIANGCVLCPTFNDPADRIALGRLSDLFPGRQVFGIHAVDLVWGLGTLHCMSQQQPA